MISFYRSHPLDVTILTAHENEGWSTAHMTNGSPTTMDAPLGTDVHTILHPLKVKSWVMKMLHTKIKSNTQHRGIDTCHHVLRQEPFASRTTHKGARIGSWAT
jgi:hypothetical protein